MRNIASRFDSGSASGLGVGTIALTGGASTATALPLDLILKADHEYVLGKGFYSLNTANTNGLSRVKVHGVHDGGANTDGTVITVSGSGDAATTWTDTEWWNITWTSTDITANDALFGSYTSTRNSIHDCAFIDFGPSIVRKHGQTFRFERNRVLTVSPPANVNSNILYVAGSLYVRDNEFNFNSYTQNGTGKNIIVGTSGIQSNSQSFVQWWILNNRFLDADQANFSTDTVIDLEAGAASTVMRDIRVQGNTIYNGKIDYNSGDFTRIDHNTFVLTTNYKSGNNQPTGPWNGSVFFAIATGAQADGDCIFENNWIIHNGTVTGANGVTIQAVQINPTPTARKYIVRNNNIIVNGAGADPGSGFGVITVSIPSGLSASQIVDMIEITGNDIGFTSIPATLRPVINFNSSTSGAGYGRLKINGNRVRGAAGATEYMPATVGGAVASLFVGFGGGTFSIATTEVMDNDTDEVSLTNFMSYTGTITQTQPAHCRGNRPAAVPAVVTLPASGTAYVSSQHVEEIIFIGQDLTNSITSIQYIPANSAGGGYTLTQNLGGWFCLSPGDSLTVVFVTTKPLAHRQSVP